MPIFLEAVRAQAEENLTKAQGLIDLYDGLKRSVAELMRSRYAIHALDWIFLHPTFRTADFAASARLAGRTARRILGVLCDGGVLRVIRPGGGRRTAVLVFPKLLNIAEGKNVCNYPGTRQARGLGAGAVRRGPGARWR